MDELAAHLCDIFELETVEPHLVLRDFDLWDSLSVISLIAVLESDFGILLEAEDLKEVITVSDLVDFVSKNRLR